MAEAITKTSAELFGETKTATELFGNIATGAELFQTKDETPSGDEFVFGPVPFRKPIPKLYTDIFGEDADWDRLLPMDERIEIRDAMVDWGDYDESGSRMVNAIYFADQLGIEPKLALDLHDEMAKAMFDEEGPPEKVFGRIKNRFHNGRTQVKIMDFGYDILIGRGDYKQNLQAISKLQSQLKGDYREDFRGLPEQMAGATAEQLPIMWQALKEAPAGAIVGGTMGVLIALVGGQLGPQALTPEEAVTVPAAATLGIKIGGGIAAANRIRQLEAGGMFLELLEMTDENGNKIDPIIAKAASHAVGAINGGIELAEWAVILSTFGIGTKILENAAGRVTTKLFVKGTIKQIVAKHLLKFTAATAVETLQEIEQETSNIVFGELAKTINNLAKGTDFTPITAEALKARYYEVAAESIKGFPLLLAPGTLVTGVAEVITAKPPIKAPPKPEVPVIAPPVPAKPPAVEVVEPAPEVVEKPPVTPVEVITPVEVAPAVEEAVEITTEEVELTKQEKADIAQIEVEIEKEPIKPSKRKPAKRIREFLTGKVTVDRLIKESAALKAAFKKAAQAARKAFAEARKIEITKAKEIAKTKREAFIRAKKEAIVKVKEHYTELKARQKAKDQLKARISKAIKRIIKPAPKNIDFFYREAVENLQEGIDPKFRTKKTIQTRERMREFLERATPEQLRDFPVKLAKILNKKNVRDYTVEELEQVADQIEKLKKLGKTKRKALLAVEKAQRKKNIKAMVKSLAGVEKLSPQPPQGFETNKDGVIKKLISTWLWTLRIPRILDWIDGRKGTFKGLAHRLFYDKVNEQYDAELRQTDKRHEAGVVKMKELGIVDGDLVTVVDFSELGKDFSLLIEQMMGVYMAVKNNLSLDALVNGNKITQKMADVIISNLSQKYKDLADWIAEEYDSNYARLRSAHIEFTNEDLGRELNYTPMIRLEKNDQVIEDEIANQLLQRVGLKRGYAEKGFTITRKNIAPEHQKRIDLRLVSVWRSQVAKQEHYIHFAKPIKDMRAMLIDADFRRAVTEKLSGQAIKILDNWVSRVANPNIYRGFSGIENLARQTRQNVAMAYLSFNLLTIGKQLPSIILYAKDAGLAAMISSIIEVASNPIQTWEKVRTKDPQVKHAFIERELEELKRANQQAHQKIVRKIGNAGMLGIGIMDGVVRTIGWNAVYEKSLANGMNEAEAVRAAQHATLRTQPAAHAKDIAQLYASDEVLNWFTMFTNQLNQIWNITTYDTFAYWNNKNYQASAASLMAVAVNAMVIWMIANKKLPEDEDDLLDAAEDQVINMIPLVGKSIMAGKRGWGESSLPPFEAAKSVGRIVTAKDKENAALKLLETGAALKGVPVVGIKRSVRFLETGKPIELVGGKKKGKKARL